MATDIHVQIGNCQAKALEDDIRIHASNSVQSGALISPFNVSGDLPSIAEAGEIHFLPTNGMRQALAVAAQAASASALRTCRLSLCAEHPGAGDRRKFTSMSVDGELFCYGLLSAFLRPYWLSRLSSLRRILRLPVVVNQVMTVPVAGQCACR